MANRPRRLKRYARDMRRSSTRAEDRVWSWLRGRRFDGVKFRRQVPIGPYIVDFYCADLMLAIELDGSQHQLILDEYDSQRTAYLRQQGLEVVRIPNEELIRDSQLVAEVIRAAIASRVKREPPHPPSAPSPPSAGEKDARGTSSENPSPPIGGEGAEGG
jgi:very-short-patch-repair endonuclease